MPTTVPEVVTRERSGLLAYLSCIRYREVLVLQGSPLLGVAFNMGEVTGPKILSLAVFAMASFLLVAHIFSFNDWAGIASDAQDPNKSADVFLTKGLTPTEVMALSFGLLAASLGLFAILPRPTLVLAMAIAALGLFYSHPATNAKAVPVLSSTPHLVGGTLHFLLGYSLFGPLDRRGFMLALFFALTFAAGHLNQEVRDHDGDRLNGLDTNAVRFGRRATFLAGLGVFTLAYLDLAVLALAGMVPGWLVWVAIVLYPIHLAWSVRTLRAELDFDTVSRFQSRYRLLYAVIGLSMLAALIAH